MLHSRITSKWNLLNVTLEECQSFTSKVLLKIKFVNNVLGKETIQLIDLRCSLEQQSNLWLCTPTLDFFQKWQQQYWNLPYTQLHQSPSHFQHLRINTNLQSQLIRKSLSKNLHTFAVPVNTNNYGFMQIVSVEILLEISMER